MTAEHEDDIVCLTTASTPFQAHLWEQVLKDQGIRCKVVGDYLEAGLGDIPGMQVEVWVHRDDLKRAQALIREGEEAPGPGTAEQDSDRPAAGEVWE